MLRRVFLQASAAALSASFATRGQSSLPTDPRKIRTGRTIPDEGYCDQPYIVRTDDGAWLCVMTTARGHEGAASQHVITTRSTDQGKTWTPPVDVEPAGQREASYAVLLKTPYGRIYCFYNYNIDFHLKMFGVVLAGANILLLFCTDAFRECEQLGPSEDAPISAKFFAATSMILVLAVLVLGRYMPFFEESLTPF